MKNSTRLAMLCAMLGNSIFGFSFMFSRLALSVTSPFVMLMYRFIFAFAGLNLVALWSVRCRKPGRVSDETGIDYLRFSLSGRPLAPLLALGIIQPVVYFLCESYGISLTNSTFSGVIIALVPIAALGLGALLLGEIPTRAQVLFSLLSIAGVVLMTLQQSAEGEIRPLGVLLLFGAVLSGVMFNILSRKTSKAYSALERTYVMMGVAAIIFTIMAACACRKDLSLLFAPLSSGMFITSMAYLSVLSSIVAFLALNYASNTLPVARTTAFCNLTTVISLFAGVVFLSEPFGVVSLFASVMIILGIWGVQREQK